MAKSIRALASKLELFRRRIWRLYWPKCTRKSNFPLLYTSIRRCHVSWAISIMLVLISRNKMRQSSLHFAWTKWRNPFSQTSLGISKYLIIVKTLVWTMPNVTGLGYLWKVSVTNFLTQFAQIFGNFGVYFKNVILS